MSTKISYRFFQLLSNAYDLTVLFTKLSFWLLTISAWKSPSETDFELSCEFNSLWWPKSVITKVKTPLLGSVPNKPTVIGMESMEDDHSWETLDAPNKKTDYYADIMGRRVALCKHFTLPLYTQVWVKLMTKIFGLTHTELKNSLRTWRDVRSANDILLLVAHKPFVILFTNFSGVDKIKS